MTIELTQAEYCELHQEAQEEKLQFDSTDKLDITYSFNVQFLQGWTRAIDLREGIELSITQIQNKDCVVIIEPELQDHLIELDFWLSGSEQWRVASALSETLWPFTAGKYLLASPGSRDQLIAHYDTKPLSRITFAICPEVLRSFTTDSERNLPKYFQHLAGPVNQDIHRRAANIHPTMATALQQILHCPYQGMVKRAYLESKTIELIALVLDHEVAIQQGNVKKGALKPEQIERIHYAREILLREMYNPPSLAELAYQVGLNDFLLKKGFRQVFGNTVFGELQAHRLELAKQLLAEGNLSAAEISRLAGYASPNSFAKAFRKNFGFSPTAYRKSCRST